MSKLKVAGGGIRFSVFLGIVGAAVSFMTQPVFIGAAGFGMAALVGAGTFIGAAVLGTAGTIAGMVVGGAVLGITGVSLGGNKLAAASLAAGVFSGAVLGSFGGSAYGGFKGYTLSENALVEKTCRVPFNDAVAKMCLKTNVYTPASKPTIQSDI